MNIEKKVILNKREYLGPVWLQMSGQPMIFPFVQYSLIHDLALKVKKFRMPWDTIPQTNFVPRRALVAN